MCLRRHVRRAVCDHPLHETDIQRISEYFIWKYGGSDHYDNLSDRLYSGIYHRQKDYTD